MAQQIVWITGASSGIGEALTYQYATRGAKIIISARREAELARVKQNCDAPANIFILPLDLSDTQNAAQWVDEAILLAGAVPDLLINNGGMGHLGNVADMPETLERLVFEVNYWSHVAITKAILPHMLAEKKGTIVAISSILGHFGSPGLAAYAASKHAVLGFFESLREELHETPIEVLVVSPGFINTSVTKSSLMPDGSIYGGNSTAQQNGMPAKVFAKKLIHKIDKKQSFIFIGKAEILAVPFKHFWPTLFYKVMRYLTKLARNKH